MGCEIYVIFEVALQILQIPFPSITPFIVLDFAHPKVGDMGDPHEVSFIVFVTDAIVLPDTFHHP